MRSWSRKCVGVIARASCSPSSRPGPRSLSNVAATTASFSSAACASRSRRAALRAFGSRALFRPAKRRTCSAVQSARVCARRAVSSWCRRLRASRSATPTRWNIAKNSAVETVPDVSRSNSTISAPSSAGASRTRNAVRSRSSSASASISPPWIASLSESAPVCPRSPSTALSAASPSFLSAERSGWYSSSSMPRGAGLQKHCLLARHGAAGGDFFTLERLQRCLRLMIRLAPDFLARVLRESEVEIARGIWSQRPACSRSCSRGTARTR